MGVAHTLIKVYVVGVVRSGQRSLFILTAILTVLKAISGQAQVPFW